MAIQSIKLNQISFDELGIGICSLPLELYPLDLHSLGKTVVLAGPNGAGKTRLLGLLKDLAPKLLSADQVRSLNDARLAATEQMKALSDSLVPSMAMALGQSTASNNTLTRGIEQRKFEIVGIDRNLKILSTVCTTPQEHHAIVSFVPKTAVLRDPSSAADVHVKGLSEYLKAGAFDSAEQSAPAYARGVLRASYNAFVNRSKKNISEVTEQEQKSEKLLTILRQLLGNSIEITLNDDLNLKIGPIDEYWKALSEGQQILFQYACMLHSHAAQIEHCILLMDEPENHLHPAVMNEVIDGLKAAIEGGNGQIWIATHSVPLIAHLVSTDPDCLWYANEGEFSRAGLTPGKVLEGLMGGDSGTANLQAFAMLPAQYSALRFMAECLVEPAVVGPNVKDPQNLQIADALKQLSTAAGDKLRVLDFGAGVGRLLPTLVAIGPNPGQSIAIDYRALEPDARKHPALAGELKAVYGAEVSDRIFADAHSMGSKLDARSVHVVVMCNVLHEIHPGEWPILFAPNGPLLSSLADDGFLLVVEDYGIPAGERAHEFGFLLLDEGELAKLFDISEADRQQKRFIRQSSDDPKYTNRLVAHLIAKSCLAELTAETRKLAIEGLQQRMRDEVARHLNHSPTDHSHKAGRDYARYAQLFTNASIWLSKQ